MQTKKALTAIKDTYFDSNLDPSVQILHLFLFMGIAGGIIAATLFVVTNEGVPNIVISLSISALGIAVLQSIRLYRNKLKQANQLNRKLVEQNESLARYDRMKSRFLSMVAHEIGTPMTTIMASGRDTLDLLNEVPLNIEEIAENQRRIEQKVILIDGIVTDLMDAVAIESGRLSLNRQSLDLSELLEVSGNAYFKCRNTNYNHIAYYFQPDLPPVSADPMRIEQVILNIISNAVRHTYNDTIEVKLTRSDNAQVVSITDNGDGMSEETKQVAFDQDNTSSREEYWRHGFGLHICYLIISAHGGEIWIDSEKGRGTSVSFSLKEEISL